jgi:hypothetical protein
MAHRRALPWVIATAVILGAVALVAQRRSHGRTVAQAENSSDTGAIQASVTAPSASAVSVAPSPAGLTHLDSTVILAMPAPHPAQVPRHAQENASTLDMSRFSDSLQHAQLRMADSIQRAVSGLPFGKIVRLDSIMAQIQPEIDRARRQGIAAGTTQRHYWLMPNGDSSAAPPLPPDAPLSARRAAAAREIRAHIARMTQRFDDGDARGARQEFTMAAAELPILRELDPNPQHTASLQRELAEGVREVVASCNRQRADSTLAQNIRCENLFGLQNRFRQFRQPPR